MIPMPDDMKLSNADWQKRLTPKQYECLREGKTEPAFTGEYVNHDENGVYSCAGCNAVLFSSTTKYHSGSGWPSFWEAVGADVVRLVPDKSLGMNRVEVRCARCDGHLGHLFDDGPREKTGKRYCINSSALKFEPVS